MRLPHWWPSAALSIALAAILAIVVWAVLQPDQCEQARGEWVAIGQETYIVHEPGPCLVRGDFGCTLRASGRDVERTRTIYECRGGDNPGLIKKGF